MESPDFREILKVLARREVDFILVGGVAAVLQGVPVSTFDIDIVHSREAGNVDRLINALIELNAYYREKSDFRIRPDRARLEGAGHHLLLTNCGPLDVLGVVVTGATYSELIEKSVPLDLGEGLFVYVLDLQAIIEIKEVLNRESDRAVLPILRRTLQQRRENSGSPLPET